MTRLPFRSFAALVLAGACAPLQAMAQAALDPPPASTTASAPAADPAQADARTGCGRQYRGLSDWSHR